MTLTPTYAIREIKWTCDDTPGRRMIRSKQRKQMAHVRRHCLRCDKPFLAVGRYNRLCQRCVGCTGAVITQESAQ